MTTLPPLTDVPLLPEGIVEMMTDDERGIRYYKPSGRAPYKAWIQNLVVELWQQEKDGGGSYWAGMGTFPDLESARRAVHVYLAMGMYDDS